MSSSHTLEQFIKFSTDSVGLERTLRLLQATVQILGSIPLAFELLIHSLNSTITAPPSPTAVHTILLALRQRLALARRFFRLFRFLDSFHAAQKLYSSISSSPSKPKRQPSWVRTETWLDIFGKTFNGMYLLLESATMIETLRIEGLRVWSPQWERTLTIEAQRFWLFALVCGVVSGLLKMLKVMAYTPVPATGDGFSHGKTEGKKSTPEAEKKKDDDDAEVGEFDMKKEQARLRKIVAERKKGRVLWRREVRAKIHGLGRGVVANILDIALPGSVVGWVDVGPGTVGLAMFVTTILTGMDAWERCGREVLVAK